MARFLNTNGRSKFYISTPCLHIYRDCLIVHIVDVIVQFCTYLYFNEHPIFTVHCMKKGSLDGFAFMRLVVATEEEMEMVQRRKEVSTKTLGAIALCRVPLSIANEKRALMKWQNYAK